MQQKSTAARRGWLVRAGIGLPVLLMALALHAPAEAKKSHGKPAKAPEAPLVEQHEPPRAFAGLSQDRIIAIAEKRYQAKVLKVKEGIAKDRRVYVLRLMSQDGKRVWEVKLDAETGGEI